MVLSSVTEKANLKVGFPTFEFPGATAERNDLATFMHENSLIFCAFARFCSQPASISDPARREGSKFYFQHKLSPKFPRAAHAVCSLTFFENFEDSPTLKNARLMSNESEKWLRDVLNVEKWDFPLCSHC